MNSAPQPKEFVLHEPEMETGADVVAETAHQYEVLNSPEDRAKYLTLTDALIYKMVEEGTDVAIFLDKSARPVAWMVDQLWGSLAPEHDASGRPTKKPEIKFLNIDREQWGAILGRSEVKEGGINADNLPAERLNELRALYKPIIGHSEEGDESLLTGKRVMVVDEVKMSGDTLDMSKAILQKAFPDAKEIKGSYWMLGGTVEDRKSGARYGSEVPVWYSDREVTGRLVGNRDTSKSNRSNSYRQRVGRYWLSTPFREPDIKGRRLKEEVGWMASDLQDHKLIYMPSHLWSGSFDSTDDRIERLNGIDVSEYAALLKEAPTRQEFVETYSQYMQDKTARQ